MPGTASQFIFNPQTLSSLPEFGGGALSCRGSMGSWQPGAGQMGSGAGPGTCRGMTCPARRWSLMVSSGAGSVTHCPLLWMTGVRGAQGGGGRLLKASTGTWRETICHEESGNAKAAVLSLGAPGSMQGPGGGGAETLTQGLG